MKFFAILTKKNLCLITAAVIILLSLAVSVDSIAVKKQDGSTNALRVSYIKSLGYEVNETAVSQKEITIPQTFSDVYINYNQMQKKAGFDLSDYKGEKAAVYTYCLSYDSGVNVTLIVHDGTVIGGDIAETRLDGEMKPLIS